MVHGRVGGALLDVVGVAPGHRMPVGQRVSMNHCSAVSSSENISIRAISEIPFR